MLYSLTFPFKDNLDECEKIIDRMRVELGEDLPGLRELAWKKLGKMDNILDEFGEDSPSEEQVQPKTAPVGQGSGMLEDDDEICI